MLFCVIGRTAPIFLSTKCFRWTLCSYKNLFGVQIEPADGLAPVNISFCSSMILVPEEHLFWTRWHMFILIQVWNNDVKLFCVKDSSGSPIAYFYFDPYSRPSEKRQGAWMNEVVSRSRVMSRDGTSARLPIAYVVCNQTPPIGNKPSLMKFSEVSYYHLWNKNNNPRATLIAVGSGRSWGVVYCHFCTSAWSVMTLPVGKKIVGCKMVFTVNYNFNSSVERYKLSSVCGQRIHSDLWRRLLKHFHPLQNWTLS